MFCPSCGAPITKGDRFCERCGHPLTSDEAAVEQSSANPSSPPAPESLPRYEPFPTTPPPGSSSFGSGNTSFGGAWQQPTVASPNAAPGGALSAFGAPLAGWWQRAGSIIIDSLIIGIPYLVINAVLNAAFGKVHTVLETNGTTVRVRSITGPAHLLIEIVLGLVACLYFTFLNGGGNGQTVGNRAPGIAVRDATTGEVIGHQRGFIRVFVRFILYAAVILPGLLNDLFPLWDRQNQSIADKAARSVVIKVK